MVLIEQTTAKIVGTRTDTTTQVSEYISEAEVDTTCRMRDLERLGAKRCVMIYVDDCETAVLDVS